MLMKIERYFNTTEADVVSKQHNIWFGVSLGNPYFTEENIQHYIEWSLKYTKEKVLVVVADEIYAINLEVLGNKSLGGARRRAMKLGENKHKEIQNIISRLAENEQSKVQLTRWSEIVNTEYYQRQQSIIFSEFQNNKEFHDHVVEIVKVGRSDRASRIAQLSDKEMDRLAEYVLNEIPHFVNGVQGYDEHVYTLIPYPGLSRFDDLFVGINNGTLYSGLSRRLEITNKIAIVEAYPD